MSFRNGGLSTSSQWLEGEAGSSTDLKPTGYAKRARNPLKSQKFFAMKDEIKATAPHIMEWFDGASNNKQETQTQIIDNCFKKSNGKWVLDLANPFFKESKTR